ncbi:MAG TPA: hypothetical protein VFU91_03225 [Sphingomicrobium sp.]|nr:hypothetical protein [Sphingomicrobium sp.]
MRTVVKIAAVTAAALASAPASSNWYMAQSKHFVIYADEDPQDLQNFATKLERFDSAGRHVMRIDDPPIGLGNRVEVYVLPTTAAVQQLAGDKNLDGYYVARAEGPLAFVPRHVNNGSEDYTTDLIFFHEYAHHLQMQQLNRPYPEWLVEGFAEFMSTARFDRDGSVLLGAPAQHRAWDLFEGKQIPLESLLAGNYSNLTPEERSASVYGRGWLLTHYLTFDAQRSGQLNHYLDAIAAGTEPLEAARLAFGDLKKLDKDLNAYLNRSRITAIRIAKENAQPGAIQITPMSAADGQVVPLRARIKMEKEPAEPLAAQVRALEQAHPGDELVEAALAEAELKADHADAAEAAADRALKANPRDTEALVFKADAIEKRAKDADGDQRHEAFERARQIYIAANKIDTEDPEPLFEFYRSFLHEGRRPTANALAALHYASDLAPQDLGLRVNSAIAYLEQNDLKDARAALAPVAYSPHGGSISETAARMIAEIDKGDARAALESMHVKASAAGSR